MKPAYFSFLVIGAAVLYALMAFLWYDLGKSKAYTHEYKRGLETGYLEGVRATEMVKPEKLTPGNLYVIVSRFAVDENTGIVCTHGFAENADVWATSNDFSVFELNYGKAGEQ